jgi:predicted esterase
MRVASTLILRVALLAVLCVTSTVAGAQRGRGAQPQRGAAPQGRGRGASATASRVQRRTYLFTPTNEQMVYAVYVSPNVKLDKPSPLVIVLHGLNAEPMGFLPQVADAVPNSGYIMGNSMGGAGAIHLGIKHRDIWAAVGARAAAIRSWIHSPKELEPARDLPMVLVHGDADRLVPVEQARQWAAEMKALKMTYEYHELKGVGHGVDPEGVRAIFKFFDAHSKPAGR